MVHLVDAADPLAFSDWITEDWLILSLPQTDCRVSDRQEIVVSYRGHGADAGDPFANDPFGTAPPWPQYGAVSSPTQMHPSPGSGPPAPRSEANTLATLSVIFAFVFAPAGAVLGHLALSQIKRAHQPGRRRAMLGLTLSYFVIALAVIVLIVWLLLDANKSPSSATTNSSPPVAAPSISSTVITPPPQGRHKVSVAQLRVGDCVEIQKNEPDPTKPNTDQIYIYRAKCEVRDGVFQITQKTSNPSQCSRSEYLTNDQQTIVACFVKYGPAGTPS